MPDLPLADMSLRHSGLTQEIADYYLQAARVCLDRHHTTPTEFMIREGAQTQDTSVNWNPTDEKTQNAWANEIDTTEAGAYCCSLAATELVKNMVAIRRAETLTGADYYVGPIDGGRDDLENAYRLEVSGTDKGSESRLKSVLRQKVQQTIDGKSNLPAIAAVVGFQTKLILIEMVT